MSQHMQRIASKSDTDWVINANYTTSGAGLKHQITPLVIIELLYNNFWEAKNAGFGQSFNIGIKYIR